MSDKTLSIRISAKDDASATMKKIGSSATTLGDELEEAGQDGQKALKQIDAQAKQTERSMGSLEDRSLAVGAAIGTMVGFASKAGAAYKDQQRQIDGINRLYGEQADVILSMSENIQDFTRYSNDAARESALVASSLTANYDLSAEQVSLLIERSADLAQIYGVDLVDAVTRTSGAIRGEGEAFERLGGNMSDAAVAARALEAGITNWNVPGALSEAEKAAFRFQLFLEDTANASGAAADAADNAGGRIRQFANEFGDAGQAVGGFLGPIGSVAAELAPISLALPLVGAGLGKFRTALQATGSGARIASVGVGLLSAATTPLGLALTGIAAGGFVAYKLFQDLDTEARNLALTFGILDELIEGLKLQGEVGLADQVTQIKNDITEMTEVLGGADFEEISKRLGFPEGTTFLDISGPNGLQNQLQVANDQIDDFAQHISDTLATLPPDAQKAYLEWINTLLAGVEYTVDGTNLDEIISEVLLKPASEVPGVMDAINGSSTAAGMALAALGLAAGIAGDGMNALRSDGEKMADSLLSAMLAAGAAAIEAGANQVRAIQQFNEATTAWLSNGDNVLNWWLEYNALANQGNAVLDGTTEQLTRLQAAMDFRGLVEWASGMNDANQAMDQVLRTFDQIDSLGARGDRAGSIAEALVGTPGEWAVVDDLLERWLSVADTTAEVDAAYARYNATVEAGYGIQQQTAEQQMLLNDIRAQQLPLLEQESEAYTANLASLAAMGPLEQRRALMLQDTAVQTKIANDYALAYSASIGEIPYEVATSVILQSAEADAGLMDLYLSMGLIEEVWVDGEKTLRVNFPDGPTVQEAVMGLTESIDRLYVLLGGDPLMLNIGVNDEATPVVEDVISVYESYDGKVATGYVVGENSQAMGIIDESSTALNNLDGDKATVHIVANDMASGVINGAMNALNALNGKVAETTIRTIYESRGIGTRELRNGGIVPRFANGGVVPVIAGEVGPEIAHFANGGTALLPTHGLYGLPASTYVSPNNAVNNSYGGASVNVTVNVAGSVTTERDLTENIGIALLDAITKKFIDRNIAIGVRR